MALVTLTVQLFALLAGSYAFPGTVITHDTSLLQSYDYIIIGGGTSGLVVATRLSENSRTTVLVLEAGRFVTGQEEFANVLKPARRPGFGDNTPYFWPNLTSAPNAELSGRRFAVQAARIVGGASAVNGMVWGRASKRDFNDWAEYLEDKGWGWESMRRYLNSVETFSPPTEEFTAKGNVTWDLAHHGREGPIKATFPPYFYESLKWMVPAERAMGVPQVKEQASGEIMGGAWIPNSIRPREFIRSYTKKEYYEPVKDKRRNLHLVMENTVTRILFNKNKEAVGVEYARGSGEPIKKATADKEVIMAAGTIKGAPLLQISGVGSRDLLKKLGVLVVADIPAVGEGFSDHAWYFMSYNLTSPREEALWFAQQNRTFLQEQHDLWINNRTGLFTTTFNNRMLLLSLPFLLPNTYPQVLSKYAESASPASKYLHPGAPPSFVREYKKQRDILLRSLATDQTAVDENITGRMSLVLRPLSRGTISAATASVFDPPAIDYRTLSHPLDREILLAGVRFNRGYMARLEMRPLNPVEVEPGAEKQSDEELLEVIQRSTQMNPSSGHPCCTLGMGTVLDSKMRVKGLKRLRVVDSSAWPFIPGAHATQSTAYGVAERAADLIKADK